MEFCDFAGQKAAEKLQKHLHLQEVQDVIPSFYQQLRCSSRTSVMAYLNGLMHNRHLNTLMPS